MKFKPAWTCIAYIFSGLFQKGMRIKKADSAMQTQVILHHAKTAISVDHKNFYKLNIS